GDRDREGVGLRQIGSRACQLDQLDRPAAEPVRVSSVIKQGTGLWAKERDCVLVAIRVQVLAGPLTVTRENRYHSVCQTEAGETDRVGQGQLDKFLPLVPAILQDRDREGLVAA